MSLKKHLELRGKHAPFSASKSSWLRYSKEKMVDSITSQYRVTLGTELHEFAASQIELNNKVTSIKNLKDNFKTFIYIKYFSDDYESISSYGNNLLKQMNKLPNEVFETVKLYVNDAIGYRMSTEEHLYYSDLFFGTTDAICFKNNCLRIHDLKTGVVPAHIEQLEIYAALYCLENKVKPAEIDIELRIYQNGEVLYHNPAVDEIVPIMDKIVTDNKYLEKIFGEQ